MFILIYHMCHNQKTTYSWNRNTLNNALLLDLIFPNFLIYEPVFLEKICMYIIINLNIQFPTSIVRYCMWSICSSSTEISINSHILCSLMIPKYLSYGILDVQNIIISKDGFKYMLFLHIYYNA